MTDGGHDTDIMQNLVEMMPVHDIYADGLANVEPLTGDNFRATYFSYQRLPGARLLTRVVCAKIIRPRSSLVSGQMTAMLEAWMKGPSPPQPPLTLVD